MLTAGLNRNNGPIIWVSFNAKEGFFSTGAKKNNDFAQHFAVENVQVKKLIIGEEKNYDDPKKMDKVLNLHVKAADGSALAIKFKMSLLTTRLVGGLLAADLTKPITLSTGAFEAGSKGTKKNAEGNDEEYIREAAQSFLTTYQDGNKLKPWFSDDPAFSWPKTSTEVLMPSGAKVKVEDPTDRNNLIIELAKTAAVKIEAAVPLQPSKIDIAPAASPSENMSAADFGLPPTYDADEGASDAEKFAQPA